VRQSRRRHLLQKTDTQPVPARDQRSTLQKPPLNNAMPPPWFEKQTVACCGLLLARRRSASRHVGRRQRVRGNTAARSASWRHLLNEGPPQRVGVGASRADQLPMLGRVVEQVHLDPPRLTLSLLGGRRAASAIRRVIVRPARRVPRGRVRVPAPAVGTGYVIPNNDDRNGLRANEVV